MYSFIISYRYLVIVHWITELGNCETGSREEGGGGGLVWHINVLIECTCTLYSTLDAERYEIIKRAVVGGGRGFNICSMLLVGHLCVELIIGFTFSLPLSWPTGWHLLTFELTFRLTAVWPVARGGSMLNFPDGSSSLSKININIKINIINNININIIYINISIIKSTSTTSSSSKTTSTSTSTSSQTSTSTTP